jgi:hypothetical protein
MALNWLAVIAAALSAFVLGGLWRGPLFANAWMKAPRVTPEQVKNGDKAIIFGGAFVLALITAGDVCGFSRIERQRDDRRCVRSHRRSVLGDDIAGRHVPV